MFDRIEYNKNRRKQQRGSRSLDTKKGSIPCDPNNQTPQNGGIAIPNDFVRQWNLLVKKVLKLEEQVQALISPTLPEAPSAEWDTEGKD